MTCYVSVFCSFAAFVAAAAAPLQGSMDLAPYLYVLPLELTPFLDVLAALGGQEAFSAAQYTTVLQVCGFVQT
jgi:hypothetical protein